MKTARTFLFCALALAPLAARAQTPAQTPPPPRAPSPAAGTVNGSTYTNQYFGLTLTLPAGWVVQGDAAKKEISEGGKKLMGSKDPATDAQIDKAIESTLNLLTATRYARDAPSGEYNSGLMCLAEKVPPGSIGVTDEDYIAVLKNTFKYSQLPITLVKDGYTETVGGETFSVMDLSIDVSGTVVRQKYYAHIRRGYALSFILSYQTPEQLAVLSEVVKSVRLR
jgi:hypothetical protein